MHLCVRSKVPNSVSRSWAQPALGHGVQARRRLLMLRRTSCRPHLASASASRFSEAGRHVPRSPARGTYVMSATHSWSAPGAPKSRSTRSGAGRASRSRLVVHARPRREIPSIPAWRMSREIRLRPTATPSTGADHRTRRSTGSRWSTWCVGGGRPSRYRGSSSRRRSRSGTGFGRPSGMKAPAQTA